MAAQRVGTGLFERLHERLAGDAWLVGPLEILTRELGVKRLVLEGGGASNGAFLRAGLIAEISLVICPAADGAKGAPSVFDSGDDDPGAPAPVRSMTLESSAVLEGGAVWLRYRLQSD